MMMERSDSCFHDFFEIIIDTNEKCVVKTDGLKLSFYEVSICSVTSIPVPELMYISINLHDKVCRILVCNEACLFRIQKQSEMFEALLKISLALIVFVEIS